MGLILSFMLIIIFRKPLISAFLFLKDKIDIKHAKERFNLAVLNRYIFAHDITANSRDTASFCRRGAKPKVEETVAATNFYTYLRIVILRRLM